MQCRASATIRFHTLTGKNYGGVIRWPRSWRNVDARTSVAGERCSDCRERSPQGSGAVSAPRTARRLRWRALIACVVTIGLLFAEGGERASAGALLPERGGSPNADRIASLYTVVLVLAALVFTGVAVTLVFSLVRYRERRNRVP